MTLILMYFVVNFCDIPHRLERKTKFFIIMWKPLPNIHVLKTLKENSKWKVQRKQHLLVVDLGRYK